MRVFYKGFNLYGQFPGSVPLQENFIDYFFQDLEAIEFGYTYSVLLVAGRLHYVNNSCLGEITCANSLNDQIKEFCLAGDKIVVLTKDGLMFKIDKLQECKRVPRLDTNHGDFISKLSCGQNIQAALSDRGSLFNSFHRLKFKSKNIIDIKTGREHCLILLTSGKVYSFGGGSRGQLGHGSLDDEEEPRLIEGLAGIKIEKISAGGWHSCAISKDGDLYTWGWNCEGQLGQEGGVLAFPLVVNVDFDDSIHINEVAAGSKHTIILLDNNELWGCGWNKHKQLKNSEQENIIKFELLHEFANEKIVDVRCGPWCSYVLSST